MGSPSSQGCTMLRFFESCRLIALLALAGCSSRQPEPAAVPTPAQADAPAPSPTVAAPSPPQTTPALAPSPAPPKQPAVDPALRALAERLVVSDGHGGWRRDEQAATDLEKLGPEALDRLWPLLKDASADVRRGAAFTLLGQIDPHSSDQATAFGALLDDQDATIRGLAVDAIKEFRREQQIAILPKLAEMLNAVREPKADNRAKTSRLLASLKSDAAAATDALGTAAAGDPDPKVRTACLVAIAQVAPPEQAAPLLARGLSDGEAAVRQVAAARLRQLGPAATPAAKQLAAALADDSLRETAAETLILIGVAAVPTLAEQLTSQQADVRKYALACLAKIGPAAKDALPAVQKCLQDPDEGVRTIAAAAAARIAPAGKSTP